MSDSLLKEAEDLIAQCRATFDSHHGNPLRSDRISMLCRQLVGVAEKLTEREHIRESFTKGTLRHLRSIFAASSTGTNGHRSWRRNLDQDLKTALISAHSFIHRHK